MAKEKTCPAPNGNGIDLMCEGEAWRCIGKAKRRDGIAQSGHGKVKMSRGLALISMEKAKNNSAAERFGRAEQRKGWTGAAAEMN